KEVFMFRVVLVIVVIFQMGCTSKGFNRGELKQQMGAVKPQYDDKDIKSAFNKKSNLPKPFKLAIYFKTPKIISPTQDWRWTEQDKALFDEIRKQLIAEKTATSVFPLISSLIDGEEDLRSLRLLAAKHQADALLVVSGATQIDRYINSWGWSYAFILPTFFVKGSEADVLFLSSAALWDVKNEYLYLTAESEEIVHEKYTAAFGKSDKDLIAEAKTKSLQELSVGLQKMIRGEKNL
ncbi:hypothetical protein K2X05_13360, partial [bacterium]|nr:hypothetical protein [bacterium]